MTNIETFFIKHAKESTFFKNVYKKLYNEEIIDKNEEKYLLRIAIYLVNQNSINLCKLGYSIILRYCNKYNFYIPLYDISLNLGFTPITKFIESHYLPHESFQSLLMSSCLEEMKVGNKYLTTEQKGIQNYFNNNNCILIAPTSYGKSETAIQYIVDNCIGRKICIIVPTKALLAEVKKKILDALIQNNRVIKIISHPDMFNKDEDQSFIGILTQERLFSLIAKYDDFCVDEIFIDEAHNLLISSSQSMMDRNVLLAQVISIIYKRNNSIKIKYLSPFIENVKSLTLKYNNITFETKKVSEFLKIERYFLCENRKIKEYNPFISSYVSEEISECEEPCHFIKKYTKNRSLTYVNRPITVEKIAKDMMEYNEPLLNIENSKEYKAIKEYLHEDYLLLDCLKHGIIYHHGEMPDNIKLYVENIFKTNSHIKFMLTTSTLLEGVNISADSLFLYDIRKGNKNLTHSNFMNLVGRVCRFSDIFCEGGDLNLLEPKIYILGKTRRNENRSKFLEERTKVFKEYHDEITNPLIENSKSNNIYLDKHIEFIENVEKNTILSPSHEIKYASSNIAKLCFSNLVKEFDIILNEEQLVDNFERYKNERNDNKISNVLDLLIAINLIFIENINNVDENLLRLRQEKARTFYKLLLEWNLAGFSYKEYISKFLNYWNSLDDDNCLIYFGSSRGEVSRDSSVKGNWIKIKDKTPKERVNLAILKIKLERDYIDNTLMKFVEILNSLDLLDENFYKNLKYGSSDPKIIKMLQNGFSFDLVKCLSKSEYNDYIDMSLNQIIRPEIVEKMIENNENDILIFEIKYYIGNRN